MSVKWGQRAALWFPEFYDMQRIAPRAAAATVWLHVIWRLGGKCVASLLATSYLPVMCMWVAAELVGFMGMLGDNIISRHCYFNFSVKSLHENIKKTLVKGLLYKINNKVRYQEGPERIRPA